MKGLTNEQYIELSGVFYKGTRQYQSQAGLQTVTMLRLIDMSPYEGKFTRRKDARKWTLKNGQDIADAIYVGYDSGKIKLVRLNGEQVSVRLTELSDNDRNYINGERGLVKNPRPRPTSTRPSGAR